jgi:hypothetical protein
MEIQADEEKREQAIEEIAALLKSMPFGVEIKATKRPKGIKVVIEVTQEEMNELISDFANHND